MVTRVKEAIVRRSTNLRPPETELALGRRSEVVRVELLGGFRVTVGSRVVGEDAWRLRKAAALVKLLALEPNHRLHKEQAMDLLWPRLGALAAFGIGESATVDGPSRASTVLGFGAREGSARTKGVDDRHRSARTR